MLPIQHFFPKADALVYGCMGLGGSWDQATTSKEQRELSFNAIDAALQANIRFFDHADIYTRGKAEAVFGDYLAAHSGLREQLILQSKCAIRFADPSFVGRYDFSKNYIIESVHQSLQRLQTDYLDILLLHRPDQLMWVDEVAEAFAELKQQGKVKAFGVSNFGWPQLQLLQSALPEPLIANQLQMSLKDLNWLEQNVLTAMPDGAAHHYSYGTVEYCQLNNVQLQAWGSLAQGLFTGGRTPETAAEQATAALVSSLAADYQTSPEAIALAFLLKHPAGIQPVIGTTSPARIAACQKALAVNLSREHWYALYVAARGKALP
ncbi:aldo/keto reductase [Rheinheimera sediminis]|uniref:aldo/keto reductase n=1 Tax=Rheinheimera sp. YQF-1 TaxID=2499626 RepID=UPI000FDCB57B|nr:aldo/keto reductase [Rheinheimera sp. YQF-1]RVT47184.1 aldo/keto reductase [Rheinheimera sp. YQF-1]